MEDTKKFHRGWHRPHSLPHFDSPETVQFVTFRLGDSLPENAKGRDASMAPSYRWTEAELDRGRGACLLANPEIAALVEETLLTFDGERHRLWAWCIMPNHVHCLFDMNTGHRLADIVRSRKGYTARAANRLLGRPGPFWQRDYFDRYMRDAGQMARTIAYIERNPVQAGLCREESEWRWSSAWRRGDGVPVP